MLDDSGLLSVVGCRLMVVVGCLLWVCYNY